MASKGIESGSTKYSRDARQLMTRGKKHFSSLENKADGLLWPNLGLLTV